MRSQSTDKVYFPPRLRMIFPSFLETFMNICHTYSKTWRYEFNHTKSGVVTFGETKPIHS